MIEQYRHMHTSVGCGSFYGASPSSVSIATQGRSPGCFPPGCFPDDAKFVQPFRHLASFTIPTRRLRSLGTAQHAGSRLPRNPSTSGSTKGSSRNTSLGSRKIASTGEASTMDLISGILYTAYLQQAVICRPTATNSSWERMKTIST